MVSESIVSGVQIADNYSGKQSSVIKYSDSPAVVDCKMAQLMGETVTSLLDTGSQVSLIRSCLLPSDIFMKPKC